MSKKKIAGRKQLLNSSTALLGIIFVVVVVAGYAALSGQTTGEARARVARAPPQAVLQPADFGGNKCVLSAGACADGYVARSNVRMCCSGSGACVVVNADEKCPAGLAQKSGSVCCNHCYNNLFEPEKDEVCDRTAGVTCINPETKAVSACSKNCACPAGTVASTASGGNNGNDNTGVNEKMMRENALKEVQFTSDVGFTGFPVNDPNKLLCVAIDVSVRAQRACPSAYVSAELCSQNVPVEYIAEVSRAKITSLKDVETECIPLLTALAQANIAKLTNMCETIINNLVQQVPSNQLKTWGCVKR